MRWLDLSGQLHSVVRSMESALSALEDHVRAQQLDGAYVAHLPPVSTADELIEPAFIAPEGVWDAEALDQALAGFARFHTGEGLSTRVVWRLPGVVAISGDPAPALLTLVAEVNDHKRRFHEIANSVADEHERYDLIHHAFPGMVYLQVIRHIKVLEGPVQSVTFSWGRKSGSEQISLASADAKLEYASRHPSPEALRRTGLSAGAYQRRITRERDYLATLPEDTPIRWRRRLRIRPLVNVRYPQDVTPRVIQREANMPLLLVNAPDVRIRPMPVYDAGKRAIRAPRSDLGKRGVPVSRILPLYHE
jgi:DNA replication terminus site-binding protein